MSETISIVGELKETQESLKVMRMAKGYQWEIKTFPLENGKISEEDIERIKNIDAGLRARFIGDTKK